MPAMRGVAAAAAAMFAASSCSVIVGKAVPDDYDGRAQPQCTDTHFLVAADVILAVSSVAGGLVLNRAIDGDPDESGATHTSTAGVMVGIAGLAAGAVFVISGLVGHHDVDECQRAMETWSWTRSHERRPTFDDDIESDEAAAPAPQPVTRFYCTTSPTAATRGYCSRTINACQDMRPILTSEAGDADSCTEARSAVCFDEIRISDELRFESCHPTFGACNRHRDELETKTSDFRMGPCEDRQ